MKLNQDFFLHEYVPPSIYKQYPPAFCLRFVDERLLRADTELKRMLEEFYGEPVKVTINNWFWGGPRQYSAYRPPGEGPGNKTSTHQLGIASDKQFLLKNSKTIIPIKDVFSLVMEHHNDFYAIGIRRIEDIAHTPTWLHWDCANTGERKIILVKP
jgi:hypothetical protein